MCVLPNQVTIPLAPDVDMTQLYFPEPEGIIRLKVIEARNLENMDITFLGQGVSDPYCVVQGISRACFTKTFSLASTYLSLEFLEIFLSLIICSVGALFFDFSSHALVFLELLDVCVDRLSKGFVPIMKKVL